MDKDGQIRIPFLGDNDVTNDTAPNQVASWVEPADRIPLLLALSLYSKPRNVLGSFQLLSSNKRTGVWIDRRTNIVVVGLKGTSSTSIKKDLGDDFIIVSNPGYCDLSLVKEATELVNLVREEVVNPPDRGLINLGLPDRSNRKEPFFIFTGHSLGGTAAMCLTIKTPNSRGISFNGGASPTNPITQGPGPGRFTHYHIVGDLISSHMTDKAARVIRIKMAGKEFGSQKPHSSGNIKEQGRPYTAEQEDKDYQKWGRFANIQYQIVSRLLAVSRFHTKLQTDNVVANSPIPGSTRDMMQ